MVIIHPRSILFLYAAWFQLSRVLLAEFTCSGFMGNLIYNIKNNMDNLEYPQYTRPEEFHGKKVPDVLLSGHHENIRKWREQKSLEITKQKRPDLLK